MRTVVEIDREIKDLEDLRANMVGTLYPPIVTADIAKLWRERGGYEY